MGVSQYCSTSTSSAIQTLAKSFKDVHRWMKQLCLAAAGLEQVGLSHGDIRPGNLLLDAEQNLILSDLDRAG